MAMDTTSCLTSCPSCPNILSKQPLASLQEIKDVMPPVFKIEESLEERSTESFAPPLNMVPLPPMIVTEKGESLDEFCVRRYADFFTSVQARSSADALRTRRMGTWDTPRTLTGLL
jgi:hypothetical protein